MAEILRATALATYLLSVATGSFGGTVTLNTALRYAEADIDTWTDPPATRIESRDAGSIRQAVIVDNAPSVVRASVAAYQNSELDVGADRLSLQGHFQADPYWYWHMQSEWYAIGAEIEFTLDEAMPFTLSMSQNCYYWKASNGYCPAERANFSYALDGRNDFGSGGTLGAGKHKLVFSSWDDDPWNGIQTMYFAFSLQAVPAPEPASLLLLGPALAALTLAGGRRR